MTSNGIKRGAVFSALIIWMVGATFAPAKAGSDFDGVSRLTLLPGWLRNDGFYVAAVQIELAPGWKTYWRSPGSNGIPPIFDWAGSENLAQVGYFWPSPRLLDADGILTIGYEDRLLLPVLLKLDQQDAPVSLRLNLDYGVCDDVCLPARDDAVLTADVGSVHNKDAIEAAISQRSKPATNFGLTASECRLTPDGDSFLLDARFDFDGDLAAHRLVIVETGSDLIWASDTDQDHQGRMLQVEADLHYFGEGAMTLDRSALRFTLLNDGESVEIRGCSGG